MPRPSPLDTDGRFAQAFANRWDGETPSNMADYYYDIMALLGLATTNAILVPADSEVSLNDAVRDAEVAASDAAVCYAGLSGVMSFGLENERTVGFGGFWTITGQDIVTE